MWKNKSKMIMALGISAVLLPTVYSNLAEAETNITVHNCPKSHHHIDAEAYNPNSEMISSEKVDPASTKTVYCDDSTCDLHLKSGTQEKYINATNDSEYWVHVKKNKTFSYGTTDICPSS